MSKTKSCPECGSSKIKWDNPEAGTWKCQKCGYAGSMVVEGPDLKQLKEARKMEKLQKKLLRGRI